MKSIFSMLIMMVSMVGSLAFADPTSVTMKDVHQKISDIFLKEGGSEIYPGKTNSGRPCEVAITLRQESRSSGEKYFVDIDVHSGESLQSTYYNPGIWQSFEGGTNQFHTLTMHESDNQLELSSLEKHWEVGVWFYEELTITKSEQGMAVQAATALGSSTFEVQEASRLLRSKICNIANP